MRRSTLFGLAVLGIVAIVIVLRWRGGSSGSDSDRSAGGAGETGDAVSNGLPADQQRQLPPTSPFGEQFRPSATATGSAVSGRVVDVRSRKPVPYVDVTFRQGRAEASANSGATGEFEIELAPGTYDVRAIGEHVIGISPSAPVAVGRVDGLAVEIEVVRLVTVRGTVVYAGGGPVDGAIVGPTVHMAHVKGYVKTGELAATEARSDGTFALQVPPGTVELRASDGTTDGFVQLVDLEAGTERDGVEIQIDAGGGVEGIVYAPDGSAAGGVEVMVSVRVPRTNQYDRYVVETDAAGRFERSRLRPGRVVVEALAASYAPSAPVAFELAPGATHRGIELTLSDPETISGRIVDANGSPLEDVDVARSWLGSKQKYERVRSGMDGSFLFTGVGPGPHMVRARKRGYVLVRRRDVVAPAYDIVLQMPFAGGVHGTITGTGDAPVRRFAVELRSAGKPRGIIKRFFAHNGGYELFPVDPGTYEVVIRAPDHDETVVEGVVVTAGEYTDVNASVTPR